MKLLVISLTAALILVIFGFLIYSRNTSQPTPTITKTSSPNPTIPSNPSTPSPSISPNKPTVTTPKPNEKIKSPLIVKGTVPPGWMFEGSFPIQLFDPGRNFIAETQAKEVTPGSWQSGKDVEFSATLNFQTQVQSGFLILEKANPSGLEENAASLEIPVNF